MILNHSKTIRSVISLQDTIMEMHSRDLRMVWVMLFRGPCLLICGP